MALSESQIQEKIDAIHTKLDELRENPQFNYQVGNKRVDAGQYHKMLLDELAYWEKKLKEIPKEDVSAVDYDIDQFGQDKSEYEGD